MTDVEESMAIGKYPGGSKMVVDGSDLGRGCGMRNRLQGRAFFTCTAFLFLQLYIKHIAPPPRRHRAASVGGRLEFSEAGAYCNVC